MSAESLEMPWTQKELDIDDIKLAIEEGYSATLDIDGPNFTYMAEQVYDRCGPTLTVDACKVLLTAAARLDDLNAAGDSGTIQLAVALRELGTR